MEFSIASSEYSTASAIVFSSTELVSPWNCSINYSSTWIDIPISDHSTHNSRIAAIIIGVFGMLLNGLVISVIATYRPLRDRLTNTFIANLALIDATASLFLVLTTLFEDDHTQPLTPSRLPDELLCRLWYTKMPLWASLLSSTYGILALTYERYVGIVHPIWHRASFTASKVKLLVASTWLIGPVCTIGYKVHMATIETDCQCSTLSGEKNIAKRMILGLLTAFIEYFLPLIVLVYLYGRMIYVLTRTRPRVGDATPLLQPIVSNDSGRVLGRALSSLTKTLATVAVFFVACWTSNLIYFVAYFVGHPLVELNTIRFNISVLLVHANSCINPIIYCIRYHEFQKGLVWLIYRRWQS